jgi:hypothetical protein
MGVVIMETGTVVKEVDMVRCNLQMVVYIEDTGLTIS